ncbi:MAG: hypothetical protein ABIK65_04390 [Candidatus Eisenbacteria bacterium]
MNHREIPILISLILLLAAGAGANPLPEPVPTWYAMPPFAAPGEPIALALWNTTFETIEVPNTAPWRILDPDSNIVASPGFSFPMIVPVPPGGFLTWGWNAYGDDGEPIDPGDYDAMVPWHYDYDTVWHDLRTPVRIIGHPAWNTEPVIIFQSDPADLYFRNLSDQEYTFPVTSPWRITDLSGTGVYWPVSLPMPDTVLPGEWRHWSMDPEFVWPSPGTYVGVIEFTDEGFEHVEKHDPFAVVDSVEGGVVWMVEPLVNGTRSAVTLTLTNATADTVFLPDLGPWWIEHADTLVYAPASVLMIWPVPPGGSMAWSWDEKDYLENWVDAGVYRASVTYSPTRDPWDGIRMDFDFTLVDVDPSGPCLFLDPEQPSYCQGQTVRWTFTNCAPDTIGMLGQHTWWVTDQYGTPVYIPIVLWALDRFAPMETETFAWDQIDLSGDLVEPGTYYGWATFTDKLYLTRHTVVSPPVTIEPCTGVEEGPPPFRTVSSYPNPFNPSTTIRFVTAETGPVRLTLVDPAGRHVRTLVDAVLPSRPEGHEAAWDGRDNAGRPAPSGIYFYRLEAAGETHTGKLTLIR